MLPVSGLLLQAVDNLRQLVPVIEGLLPLQEHIRIGAAVRVMVRTVLHKGDPFSAGY